MRFNVIRSSLQLSTVLVVATAVACGGDSTPTSPNNPPPTPTPAISLTLAVDSITVFKGDSVTVLVTLSRTGGFTGSVALEVTGAPAGVTVDPGSLGTGSSTLLTIAADGGAADIVATLTVRASANGVATVSLPLRLSVEEFVLGLAALGADLLGSNAGDQLGRAVAISDDGRRIVVGGPFHSAQFTGQGVVRVFEWDGIAWRQVGADITGFPSNHIGMENQLAISGDGSRIVVGRPLTSQPNLSFVDVFELVGGTWTNVGNRLQGAGNGGTSVSISTDGTRIALGNVFTSAQGTGTTGVFDLVGSTWTLVGHYIGAEDFADEPGYSVDLSGDGMRLAVSALKNDGAAMDAGHVRVYDFNGAIWAPVGGDLDADPSPNAGFGQTVSMSRDGRRIAVSASPGNYVKVFEFVGGAWAQMGMRFEVTNAMSQIVGLSGDGSRLVVGYPEEGGGTVRAYEWMGGAWSQLYADVTGSPGSGLGQAVGISADGQRVVAGAPGFDSGGANDRGAVRVLAIPMP